MAAETQEQIKREAQDTVQGGANIREKIRDLTLRVLGGQPLEPGQVRAVVRAMTEGIAEGAPKAADMRRALSEGFRGLDEALTKSTEAARLAMQDLGTKGKQMSETAFKQGLEDLKRLEENFLGTVGEVAGRTQDQVRSGLQELISQARRAGTDSGRKAAEVASALSARMGTLAMDSAKFGMDAAREAGTRVAEAASGMLLGMAEALVPQARKTASKAKAKPKPKAKPKAKAKVKAKSRTASKAKSRSRAKAKPKAKRKSKTGKRK